jgi:hypothetical protein
MVKALNGFLVCHVERGETSLAVTFTPPKTLILRFFSRDCGIRMTIPVMAQPFNLSTDHAHFAICSGNGH